LESLWDILTTHGGSFQKFEFEFRSGISSNTCEQDFRKITCTVADAVPIRPKTRSRTRRRPLALRCRSLTGSSRTPASGRWKSLHCCLPVIRPVSTRADHCRGHERCQPASRGAASPTTRPRDPTASPEPPRPENFPARPPLETLAPALPRPYKKAPSTPQNTTPPQLPIPTFLSSSLPRKHPKLWKP
jgi:hypothetical protein